jgi:hypothetical protein
MKSAWLIVAVLASVVAGAGGGYIATRFAAEKPQNKVATAEPLSLDGDTQAKGVDHSDQITKLQQDIDGLLIRLAKAESANADAADLQKKLDALNKQIAELKATPTVVAKPVDGTTPPASTTNPELAAEVDRILAEREAAEDAKRDAEREKQMADMIAARNTKILDKLSTDLALTEVQKSNVQVLLDDYTVKRREVWERGNKARTDGVEFDWQVEFKTVNDAAADAVRAELSTAQVSTFNTLIGEGSLDDLAGGWGGGRNNRGGGTRTPGSGGRD